jgi:radical SAM superfamily enzyme YgiQ (UPF0313 family)
MRIFLGDLSHNTVGLATEVFPLNVGYIASYAKKMFGDKVQIELFKYIGELENAIERDPPDLLGLSNYPWCHNIGRALFQSLARRRPEALRIMGGPNFPHGADAQGVFLRERPEIDAYVYLDGEVGFANLVGEALQAPLANARRHLKTRQIGGIAQLDDEGALSRPPTPLRIQELDDIPSPYLMGLLDKFFDGHLSPMIQTNRGCPFKCTFCADGTSLVNKVNQFSVERVRAEVEYIAERVPRSVKQLHIADLNFGMYKRDAEICDALAESKRRHNYPLYIDTATGKNSKDRVITAIEKLDGVLALTMSVQSMSTDVLRNIKRDNIRLDGFLDLKPAIRKANLSTSSEIILGLPGETKRSHFDGLGQLMMAEIEKVVPYTLMLLNGSEMATPEERKRWGFQTKFRVLPRDFTKLESGENVIELEEVVISTNTLSFDEYVECRKMALLISVLNTIGFKAVTKLLVQSGIPPINVFERLLDDINRRSSEGQASAAVRMVDEFQRETREELWDSAEEIQAFFKDDENFEGLVQGRFGANLIQTYRARAIASCFDEFADLFYEQTRAVLSEQEEGPALGLLPEAEAYSRGIIKNVLDADRMSIVPSATLHHDIGAWLSDPDGRPLGQFSWSSPRVFKFVLSDEQYSLVEDVLDKFGRHDLGKGKALNRINPNVLWRRPALADASLLQQG